ncbi:nif-specific transcriptional activator NifA [Methylocaldum sp.]|uniref:nif-specific transcriptional activator NifA n=1 Tax=Methylocaldum sp. TaxID=1969727 RepID=UPI002D6098F6|nr:nif-specific transcriptional activator NifA [Methylocaldum sp.]HYE37548.1 nif-specific transcriptional activator NifA [Methylocaldum sp.]
MSARKLTQPLEKQRNLELITIYEISKILSSSLDLHKTLREALNVLSSHMHMRRCMISLVQDNTDVHVIGASGLSRDEISRGHFRKGEGIIGKVIKTGVPIVVQNIAEESQFLNRTGSRDLSSGQTIAFLGIPIKAMGETIGVLSADRDMTTYHGYLEYDVRLLKMVANLVGQTVRLHQIVAAEREQRMIEQHRLQKVAKPSQGLVNVIGQSQRMQEVFAEVERAASVHSTVLLRGETGTGKEMIAHAIHHLSSRSEGPFVRVNCAALSETLLESELFGHEKGSFTGATQERKGRFELAHGGTLFLDEIGDVSPAFQVKLLRVLQEREFERVGGNKPIQVDVRLIVATNRNLEDAVLKGEYRADLYFRINVISILLPPLRERRDDIFPLANHFLERFNRTNQRQLTLSPEAMHILAECYWPGNVRELENCVERTAAMSRGKTIRDINLPCQKNMCFSLALKPVSQISSPVPVTVAPPIPSAEVDFGHGSQAGGGAPELKSTRERLISAMEECGWVQAKAARLLGMTTRQMHYALQKYNIEIKKL